MTYISDVVNKVEVCGTGFKHVTRSRADICLLSIGRKQIVLRILPQNLRVCCSCCFFLHLTCCCKSCSNTRKRVCPFQANNLVRVLFKHTETFVLFKDKETYVSFSNTRTRACPLQGYKKNDRVCPFKHKDTCVSASSI